MQKIAVFLFLIVFSFNVKSQILPNEVSYGYPNGTLIAIGGGFEDHLIMEEFKKIAGGETANIVVIPTGLGDEFLKQDSAFIKLRKYLKRYEIENFTFLHTRDSSQANDDEFIKPLKTATGIFFTGGSPWRHVDSYLNTKVQDEMFKLLDRGGVIAGTSRGGSILGSYLARGDSKNDEKIIGDHETGLGFFTNVAIDPHVLVRNRQFDMFDILKKQQEILGIGIDENTAIIVKGDTFEVIGTSYVLIYDKTFWSSQGLENKNIPEENCLFYFLKSGDKYNMNERKVVSNRK